MAKDKPTADLLGEFLQTKRKAAGYSQWEVSVKLGYSTPQFISNWERGISSPPINVLKKIAHIYNASAEELFEVVLETKIREVTKELRRKFYGR